MKKKIIGFSLLGVGVVVFIIFLFMVSATSVGFGNNPGVKVSCTGTVEVDALGIGNAELDPPASCEFEQCKSLLSFSPLAIFAVEEGNVDLVIDGKKRDSYDWFSRIGENEIFSLESSCLRGEPSDVSIELFNEQGAKIDTQVIR